MFRPVAEWPRYEPRVVPLPGGGRELFLYLIGREGAWEELHRVPLRVRGALGVDRGRVLPQLDLASVFSRPFPFTGGSKRTDWTVRACNGNGCGVWSSSNFLFNAPGANYVGTLSAGTAKVGSQVTFTVKLQNTAESNTELKWRLSPDACYEQTSAGTPYTAGAKNSATISTGQRAASLTVGIRNDQSCRGTARIETWVRDFNSSDAPYFKALDVNITL